MPYDDDLSTLPKGAVSSLPFGARAIYWNAFNQAWDEYRDPEGGLAGSSRQETAARAAWASVSKLYEKDEASGRWNLKGSRAKVAADQERDK